MESRVKEFGHPAHPLMIVFPLGLFFTALIFDVIQLFNNDGIWSLISFYLIGTGLIFGVVAAVLGAIDWRAIPAGTRAKRIGNMHAAANIGMMILFAISWLIRMGDPARPEALAILIAFAAGFVGFLGGWLGGELVYRLGIGVYPDAHMNASPAWTIDKGEAAQQEPSRP